MATLDTAHFYTFVDTAYLHGRKVGDIARQLCDGGSDVIQLRAKGASMEQIRAMALEVRLVTAQAGVLLVINDFPGIAVEVGADFTHLGQEDFFDAGHTRVDQLPSYVREVGIGLSTHSPDQAERSIAAQPAYIAIGPVFATATKPGAQAVTLDYVRWAARHVRLPWFAIGGISLNEIDSVLEAGATRICVVSAILNAPDLVKACQDFKNRLASALRQSN